VFKIFLKKKNKTKTKKQKNKNKRERKKKRFDVIFIMHENRKFCYIQKRKCNIKHVAAESTALIRTGHCPQERHDHLSQKDPISS
jgi:hypothetical protein